MIEKFPTLSTTAGGMDTFVCHPEHPGPWPVVIFYMDAPGIREELRDMVRRIATVGYYVMLPNLYYRHGTGTVLAPAASDPNSPERRRMFELLKSMTNAMAVEDTTALLAFIDDDPAARKTRLGALGYCMGGPFVVTAAGRFPERFAAAASIHGVALMTDRPDSPHLLAGKIRGELYFAWAELDQHAPLGEIEPLRAALDRAGAKFEIEVFAQADHGFAFPQRACYAKAAAERHWERLFALFARTLR
jgi:carboxymethylenebutenolidase